MRQNNYLNMLLMLAEQIGNLFPGQRKPEYYVEPLLKWMTSEWKSIRKLIAKNLIDIASGKITKEKQLILEQDAADIATMIAFSSEQRSLILQVIGLLIGRLADGTKERAKEIKQQAKIDAGGWFQARTFPTTILLSREGLEAVVSQLDFHIDFVDDLTASTQSRIDKLLKVRYGSITDFSKQVDHTLRISRDNLLDAFHLDVDGIANRVRDGIITPAQFHDNMLDTIGKHYRKIYRSAKGVPLTASEEAWIVKEIESQRPYLNNFRDLLTQKKALNQELTSYVNNRAGLYAERGSSIYEYSIINTWDDAILIDWQMSVAEHCWECPILAQNSPYTKQSLPKIPGDGSTACGTNCKCFLTISDLYYSKQL